jgi:hypothetical protein
MTVPAAKLIVPSHRWSLEVYELAESAYASDVSQSPRMDTSPAILMVSPYVVVTISLKVTATDVAAVQALLVVLVEVLVLVDVDEPVPVVVVVVVVALLTPEVGV